MKKKIYQILLPIMIIFMSSILLIGCDKKDSHSTLSDKVQIESSIKFNSDLNGTAYPTNTFPISTDIYLVVDMNIQNKSSNIHTVSVEIYIDGIRFLNVQKVSGDSDPIDDTINNGKTKKFSGINIAVDANGERNTSYTFKVRSDKECKEGTQVRVKFLNASNDMFTILGSDKFMNYSFYVPKNSRPLQAPTVLLSDNKLNLSQTLNHNGYLYKVLKNGSLLELGSEWLMTPFTYIDISRWEPASYTVEVVARGDGTAIKTEDGKEIYIYVDSASTVFNFNILEKVNASLNKGTNTLSWPAVPNAVKYKVESKLGSFELEDTKFVVNLKENSNVTYTISAIGDLNTQSINSSVEYSIKKLQTPKIYIENNIYLHWENVAKTSKIVVYIDKNHYKTIAASDNKMLLPVTVDSSVYIIVTDDDLFTLNSEKSNILKYQLAG